MAKKKKGSEQQDLWTGRVYRINDLCYQITSGDEMFDNVIYGVNLFTSEFDLLLNVAMFETYTVIRGIKPLDICEAVIVKTKDANGINHLKKIAKRVYKYKTIKE